MHTPLILFYIRVTLWTWFTISFYPGEVLRIRLFLFIPLFYLFTRSWLMFFVLTFETETITTFAYYHIFFSEIILFYDVIASFSWAPLYFSIMICELLAMPLQVFLPIIELASFSFFICHILGSFRKISQKE